MANRLPLAIFLSALVLFVYTTMYPAPDPAPRDGSGNAIQQEADPGNPADTTAPGTPKVDVEAALALKADPQFPDTVHGGTGDGQLLVMSIGGGADEKGAYQATFAERGGSLRTLRFRGYFVEVGLSDAEKGLSDKWLELLHSVEFQGADTGSLVLETSTSSVDLVPGGLDGVDWKMEQLESSEGQGVRFTYGAGNGLVFEKLITFEPNTWNLRLLLTLTNDSHEGGGRMAQFRLLPAGVVPAELDEPFYPEPSVIAMGVGDEEAVTKSAPGLEDSDSLATESKELAFTGVHNKYFAFLMRPVGDAARISMQTPIYYPIQSTRPMGMPAEEKLPEYIGLRVPLSLKVPAVGRSSTLEFLFYAGPKKRVDILADFAAHDALLEADLSTGSMCISFNSIGNGLLWFLGIMHGITGNWGMAIILLTLCVRAALFPINRRSQTAMARYQKKMKRVTPRINEIKERFKNDPKKLREAQAKIMQEEKAFPPLGGCLPMFLQLPVFFGLFSMLRTSFDLRQEPFYFWIKDLSRPDQIASLGWELPLLGEIEYFNLLPILMVVMWILQQKGMPQPQDEQAARMQKMMTFMPIIFGFMLYNYAAGLSLYMLTSSTMAIFEQKVIKKKWPIDDAEIVSDKPGGCGPFSGFAAKLAEKQKEQMKRVQAQQAQQASQGKKRKKR